MCYPGLCAQPHRARFRRAKGWQGLRVTWESLQSLCWMENVDAWETRLCQCGCLVLCGSEDCVHGRACNLGLESLVSSQTTATFKLFLLLLRCAGLTWSLWLEDSFKQQEGWILWPVPWEGVACIPKGCQALCSKPSEEEIHPVLSCGDDTGSLPYGLQWLGEQNGSRPLHALAPFQNAKVWCVHIKRHLHFIDGYDWSEPGRASRVGVLGPADAVCNERQSPALLVLATPQPWESS